MKNNILIFFSMLVVFVSLICCQTEYDKISETEFKRLMYIVAEGWSSQDTDLALSSFHKDAIYMEPPNVQYYKGHEQLKAYFDALDAQHHMEFHSLWFNEEKQSGVGEFTFSYGKDISDVGVAVVEIKNGKIVFWREYLRKGPTNFEEFLKIESKNWQWHIGNYPEPKDTIKPN